MARLNNEVRAFVVRRLACFISHSDVRKEVREQYDVDISLQQIAGYDADTVVGARDLAKKWKTLFATTRAEFTRDTAKIPIAHKAFRLNKTMQLIARAEKAQNFALVKELLEYAAKEMGNAFTNRRVLTPGDPAQELAAILGIEPDEVRAMMGTSEEE